MISRFALKDLPDPGVPKKIAFGLLSRGTFLEQEKAHKKRLEICLVLWAFLLKILIITIFSFVVRLND